MGTTPPPSPSDKMDHVALNARVVQLSNEVDRLKKLLSKTESKRESFVLLLTVHNFMYTLEDISHIWYKFSNGLYFKYMRSTWSACCCTSHYGLCVLGISNMIEGFVQIMVTTQSCVVTI